MSFDFSKYVRLDIPEGRVKKITRKADGVVLWKAGYVNQVPISKDENGNIYNGTGYKNGYRVRSGGAEATQSTAVCTGFIPFKKGDILRISPPFSGLNTSNAINFADANFNNLGQRVDANYGYGICSSDIYDSVVIDGISTLTYSDDFDNSVAYVRITHSLNNPSESESYVTSGADMIVTINEEIE